MLKISIEGELEDLLRKLSQKTGMSSTQIIHYVFNSVDIELPKKEKLKLKLNGVEVGKKKRI